MINTQIALNADFKLESWRECFHQSGPTLILRLCFLSSLLMISEAFGS